MGNSLAELSKQGGKTTDEYNNHHRMVRGENTKTIVGECNMPSL